MQSFPLYSQLAKYTSMKGALQSVSSSDLSSYKSIKEVLNAPFEVTTISDLYRLEAYADSVIDKTSADYQAPMLNIPFTNTSIDRSIVLAAVPFFMVLLFHLLGSYVKRNLDSMEYVAGDKTIDLMRHDYSKYAPFHLLHPISEKRSDPPKDNAVNEEEKSTDDQGAPLSGLKSISTTRINPRKTMIVRRWVDFLLKKSPIIVPCVVGGTFIYNLISSLGSQWRFYFATLTIWLIGMVSVVIMLAEGYEILLLLRRSAKAEEEVS